MCTWLPPWRWQGYMPTGWCRSSIFPDESIHIPLVTCRICVRIQEKFTRLLWERERLAHPPAFCATAHDFVFFRAARSRISKQPEARHTWHWMNKRGCVIRHSAVVGEMIMDRYISPMKRKLDFLVIWYVASISFAVELRDAHFETSNPCTLFIHAGLYDNN